MLKPRLLLFIILLTLIARSIGLSQQKEESKNILILFGLAPTQPAYRSIMEGIRQRFTEEFGDSYNLHTEYLEIESYQKDNDPRNRFDIYNDKYREIKLDLLIVVGRNATNVIKNNAEDFLLNLPAISIDFDFSNYGYSTDLHLNKKTFVVGLKFNVAKMISTALSVFPGTNSIYFIGGTAPFDRFMMSLVNEEMGKVDKNKRIEIMTDLSMDQILQQVRRLPDRSLIFIPSFTTDSKLVTYYNDESMRLISATANSPVFAYSDVGFGDGAIGGYLISFRKVGLFSGETAVKILNGANPNSFIVTEQDYYEYIFDWRQLKRWNLINSDFIPAGSIIRYNDISFVDRYKWVGGLVLLFIVLQTLLIANLIRLNKNQKVMTKRIIDTENRYKDFLHQDRSLRLGQLTASLSHEINQPLTAILSNAQAGIRFIDSGEGDLKLLKQIFQKIVESDKRGASIVRSIRGMMKPDVSEKRKVELNNLINEVITVYQNETSRKNIILNTNLWNESIFVLADRIQIQQVLLNLISNAAQSLNKVTHTNKVISIYSSVVNNEASVKVRDNGAGIDTSIKEKLFEPFVTSKNTGMGIGLTISQSIIEDHQGKIWAENLPESGAEFSFTLKLFANGKK
jgi:signal transduction histidine kinase